MCDPVLHLIAGPNGAGKSTLCQSILGPVTHLEFINADVIAGERWPEEPAARSYQAAAVATQRRSELIEARMSFVTSHPSKLELLEEAVGAGYLVNLHIVMVPVALAVARVASRVVVGGHGVPETKIRERYERLWPLVASAVGRSDGATVYDNSRADTLFRVVAKFQDGFAIGNVSWPTWTPHPLRALTSSPG